jgi:preprotein translocase subunit SecG
VGIINGLFNFIIVLLSLFLIGIILIQRGKGGGLAGAFGGVGGSSAFGTKAGDVFTKITVGVAIGWIILLMMMVILTNSSSHSAFDDDASSSLAKDADSKSSKSKSKAKSPDANDVPPASPESVLPPDFPTLPVIPEEKKAPSSSSTTTPPVSATVSTPAPGSTTTPPATTPASPPAKAPK